MTLASDGAASKTSVSNVLQAMNGYGERVRVSRMRLSCDKFELQEYPVDGVEGHGNAGSAAALQRLQGKPERCRIRAPRRLHGEGHAV